MSDKALAPTGSAKLLRQVIDELGMSDRKFAKEVLSRDERTIRRWLSGESPVPVTVHRTLIQLARKRPRKDGSPVPKAAHIGRHEGFEVLPIHYRVVLNSQVPYIHVACYAINYTKRELTITSSVATQLYLPNGVPLDNIDMKGEQVLPAQSSWQIFLNAKLMDSEIRAVSVRPGDAPGQASIQLISTARSGAKTLNHTVSALTIHGWREGLAPQA